jgi:hydrogenase expression/formation protein HypE
MLAAVPGIAVLRDPTRGGLAAVLNEIARAAGVGILIEEPAVPVRPGVAAACELLGLDPLHVANEGKLVCFCAEDDADRLLAVMRTHPLGRDAARIGRVVADDTALVRMRTGLGGMRVVDWLSGEQLPRIC